MQDKIQTSIYVPPANLKLSLWGSLFQFLKNTITWREMIWQLYKRDFLASYRKSFLGYSWIFISPVFGVLSWIIMHRAGVLKPGEMIVPYEVYVLVGTSIWGLWNGIYTATSRTLQVGADLITQIKYPHEILLVKQVAEQLSNFTIVMVLNLLALFFFEVEFSVSAMFFPIALAPLILVSSAIGLMASLVSVVTQDIIKVLNVAMGFLIFLSPIMYSKQTDSEVLNSVFDFNPVTHLVCTPRDLLLFGRAYDIQAFWIVTLFSLILFAISMKLFLVGKSRIIERMV